MESHTYVVGTFFVTEGEMRTIHIALNHLAGVVVHAASAEEAEAHAAQIRDALEAYADSVGERGSMPGTPVGVPPPASCR